MHEPSLQQQAGSGKDGDQLPAAAANPFDEPHSSAFPFSTVEAFVIATKKHIKNPGGLARILWRNGAEDGLIGQWRAEQEERRELEERLRDSQEALIARLLPAIIGVAVPTSFHVRLDFHTCVFLS
jgi:hypothetical protein